MMNYSDLVSRDDKVNWILETFINYPVINPWNNIDTLAYNVKAYNLFTKDALNLFYDYILWGNSDEYYEFLIQPMIDDFIDYQKEKGWAISIRFNGRSGGYLLLDKEGYKGAFYIDRDELEEMEDEDFEGFYTLIVDFYNFIHALKIATIDFLKDNCDSEGILDKDSAEYIQ